MEDLKSQMTVWDLGPQKPNVRLAEVVKKVTFSQKSTVHSPKKGGVGGRGGSIEATSCFAPSSTTLGLLVSLFVIIEIVVVA